MPFILHLLHDSPYVSGIVSLFESACPKGIRQDYYIYHGSQGPRFSMPSGRNVKNGGLTNLQNSYRSSDVDIVIVNGLDQQSRAAEYFTDARKIWCLWGAEVYDCWPFVSRVLSRYCLLQPHTQRIVGGSLWTVMRAEMRAIYYAASDRTHFNRFDLCVAKFREEYELCRRALRLERPRFFENAITSLDFLVSPADRMPLTGRDILLGNSASATNNHADALFLLKKIGIPPESRILCPLSYGSAAYAHRICHLGAKLFGDRFTPIRDFLPLTEYNALISKCSTVVMNHDRQQAFGNILTALYRGATVYMNKTPLYDGLNRLGFPVQALSSLRSPSQFGVRLSSAELKVQRAQLESEFGRARVEQGMTRMIEGVVGGDLVRDTNLY